MEPTQKPLIQQQLVPEANQAQQALNIAATAAIAQNQQAATTQRKEFIEVPLSDGRTAVVYRPKGRVMREAMRVSEIAEERAMVAASKVTQIDGESIVYEDFLDLYLDDINDIITAFTELVGKGASSSL